MILKREETCGRQKQAMTILSEDMLDGAEGLMPYSEEDEALKRNFKAIVEKLEPFTISYHCNHDSLRKHKDLLQQLRHSTNINKACRGRRT